MKINDDANWNELLSLDDVSKLTFEFSSNLRAERYKQLFKWVISLKQRFIGDIIPETLTYLSLEKKARCVLVMTMYTKKRYQEVYRERLDVSCDDCARFAAYCATFRMYHRYYKTLHEKTKNRSETQQQYWSLMKDEMQQCINETFVIYHCLLKILDGK